MGDVRMPSRRAVRRAHGGRGPRQLRRVRRPHLSRGDRAGSPPGSARRAWASRPSTTACATGWSAASATGARRSRSSTATKCGLVPGPGGRAPRPAPRHRGLRAQGPEPAGRGHRLGQRRLPEVRRPGQARDRHDGHLRRLLLVLPPLPGSRATRTSRGAATHPTTGCPSTSTSAASSTRSST